MADEKVNKKGIFKRILGQANPLSIKGGGLRNYILSTAGYNSFPEMKKAYQEGDFSASQLAKIGVKAAAGPLKTAGKAGLALFDEAVKEILGITAEKKNMGGMMNARQKNMGLKMADGGEAMKGFSMLPESVQEKMNPVKAKKYNKGGAVKKRAKSKPKARGTGAAIRGTKFKGVF